MKSLRCASVFVVAVCLIAGTRGARADESLVDCSKKRFKSGNKADTLIGWSQRYLKIAKKAKTERKAVPEDACDKLISMRGDAYCQSPSSATYREALTDAIDACTAAAPSSTKTVVDCSEKRFHSGSSSRSLMLWSNASFEEILKSRGTGIYPEHQCEVTISRRGDAHCQDPDDARIRDELQTAIELCKKLQSPEAPKTKMTVDCSKKRFQHKQPVATLIRWSELATSALESYSDVAAEAKCQDAYSYAGSAQCLLPNDPRPRKAIQRLATVCARDAERRQSARKASADAEKKRLEQIKANRKIGKLPRSTYKGSGASSVARQMRKALRAGGVAKSAKSMLKVYPMGAWKSGRFSNTKLPYKMISGLVLWADDDGDGVCRYTTYNFEKIRKKKWGPLKFRSFCMGCPEGWTACKKGK